MGNRVVAWVVAIAVFAAGVAGADEVELVDERTMTMVVPIEAGGTQRAVLVAEESYESMRPVYEAELDYRERFPDGDPSDEELDTWMENYPRISYLYLGVGIADNPGDSFVTVNMTFDHWLEISEGSYGIERVREPLRMSFGEGSWFEVDGFGGNRDDQVEQSSWYYVRGDDTARSVVEEMARQETLIVEAVGVGGVPRRHRFDLSHVHEWIAETREWALAALEG